MTKSKKILIGILGYLFLGFIIANGSGAFHAFGLWGGIMITIFWPIFFLTTIK